MVHDDELELIAATYSVEVLLDMLDMSIYDLVYLLKEQIEERREEFNLST